MNENRISLQRACSFCFWVTKNQMNQWPMCQIFLHDQQEPCNKHTLSRKILFSCEHWLICRAAQLIWSIWPFILFVFHSQTISTLPKICSYFGQFSKLCWENKSCSLCAPAVHHVPVFAIWAVLVNLPRPPTLSYYWYHSSTYRPQPKCWPPLF